MSVKKVIKNVPTTYWKTSDDRIFTNRSTAEMHEIVLSSENPQNSVFAVIDNRPVKGVKNDILAIYQYEKEAKEDYPKNEVRQVYLSIPLDIYLNPKYAL